ncbi:MAG: glycosyltransferase family 2 protein [candidate division FCPU426 bacterium]
MSIAVIIAVYLHPRRVADMIRALLRDAYPDKEIIAAVDGESTPEIEASLAAFAGQITVLYNHEHLGKAATLNRVAAAAKSDVLLFLDNDVLLGDNPGFLSKLAGDMEKFDLAEIPKEARATSWISAMMEFEFLDYAIVTWLFSHLTGHCPAMNGAAFAVRREWFSRLQGFRPVVNEDMDFAARAFRLHARFGFNPRLKVGNEVPTEINGWLRQRKRWALNNILWLQENFINLLTRSLRSPRLLLPLLAFFAPFFAIMLAFVVFRSAHLTVLLPSLFMLSQHFHGLAGIFLGVTHYHLIIADGLLPTALALALSWAFHFAFARILKYPFKPLLFLVYYFLYAPVWMLANLVIWAQLVLHGRVQTEWKV